MSRLLLIQDDAIAQDNMARRLMRRGFQVQFVSEVQKGLDWARNQRPEIILLDMDLSDMDGWKAVQVLREETATQGVPILAMATDSVEGAEAIALDAGCAAFVHLPADLETLMGKIKPLLEGAPSE